MCFKNKTTWRFILTRVTFNSHLRFKRDRERQQVKKKQCSLQFDKMSICKMHLSIVNKEMFGIKDEKICKDLKKKPDETKALHQCEICSKTFSEKKS